MTLEVGTVLYSDARWGNGIGRHIIDRVTAKRAFSKTTEFEREQKSDYFHARGSHGWDSICYRLETPELKESYKKDVLTRHVKNIKADELSISQLTRIVDITKEESK